MAVKRDSKHEYSLEVCVVREDGKVRNCTTLGKSVESETEVMRKLQRLVEWTGKDKSF